MLRGTDIQLAPTANASTSPSADTPISTSTSTSGGLSIALCTSESILWTLDNIPENQLSSLYDTDYVLEGGEDFFAGFMPKDEEGSDDSAVAGVDPLAEGWYGAPLQRGDSWATREIEIDF